MTFCPISHKTAVMACSTIAGPIDLSGCVAAIGIFSVQKLPGRSPLGPREANYDTGTDIGTDTGNDI